MSTVTEQTVAEYFAAIRALDPDRWVATFAPDAVSHDPVGTPPMQGHAALHAFMSHMRTSFRQVNLTEDSVFACGASAAIKWNAHAITQAGKQVDFEGVDVIDTNAEGKITLVRAFWDPAPIFAALEP